EAARLENGAQRGGGDTLTKGRNNATGYKNEFGHADFRFVGRGQGWLRIGRKLYARPPAASMRSGENPWPIRQITALRADHSCAGIAPNRAGLSFQTRR